MQLCSVRKHDAMFTDAVIFREQFTRVIKTNTLHLTSISPGEGKHHQPMKCWKSSDQGR